MIIGSVIILYHICNTVWKESYVRIKDEFINSFKWLNESNMAAYLVRLFNIHSECIRREASEKETYFYKEKNLKLENTVHFLLEQSMNC